MTVGELKELLEDFNDDMEILMKPSNSIYADGISGITEKELRAYYGEDRDVLVLTSSGQEGAV
jgi:hypothetical protein